MPHAAALIKHNNVVFSGGAFLRVIEKLRELSDPNGSAPVFSAKLSLLYPGTSINPHTGPSNARLRAHLCVQLGAAPGGKLIVAGEERGWKAGEAFVFDDSFEHEVVYGVDSSSDVGVHFDFEEVRIVLIVDFWHPQTRDIVGARNFV